MYSKVIAHCAEFPKRTKRNPVLNITIEQTKYGFIRVRGLSIYRLRTKKGFVRWFGKRAFDLENLFNKLLLRNGIVAHIKEFRKGDLSRMGFEWDLGMKWYDLLENSLQSLDLRANWFIATRVFLTDNHVVLEVDDNGSGIHRSRLEQVFLTEKSLIAKDKVYREQARGFRFGGNGRFLRWFFDDITKSRGNGFRKNTLYVEIVTSCGHEKSRCVLGTDGVRIDGEGKRSAGTRIRVFYPRDSFTIAHDS